MPDFSQRSKEEELMDDLSLSGPALAKNLEELEIINRRLGGNKVVINALERLLKSTPRSQTIQIADWGTGGGDLPRAIMDWAQKKGRKIEVTGIDANPFMIQFARQKAKKYPGIRFEQVDLFSKSFRSRKFDICICSLFCHHFSDEELVPMLEQLKEQSQIGFVINDLHRNPLAWLGIQFLTWLFRGSYLVRNDGPLSVLRAFKKEDLTELLECAKVEKYELKWKWAFRWQLIGFPPQQPWPL